MRVKADDVSRRMHVLEKFLNALAIILLALLTSTCQRISTIAFLYCYNIHITRFDRHKDTDIGLAEGKHYSIA